MQEASNSHAQRPCNNTYLWFIFLWSRNGTVWPYSICVLYCIAFRLLQYQGFHFHNVVVGEKPANFVGIAFELLFICARRYASAVCAMTMCLSVRLSVCHKLEFYRNGWTDRAGFFCTESALYFLYRAYCVIRNSGFCKKDRLRLLLNSL